MAALETIQPYVEQLFDDSEVQRQLARARANLRAAQARAGKAKSKKQALQDERLRRRLMEAARAAVALTEAIKAGPEKQRKRSRRKGLLALALVGAGAYLAINERERIAGLMGSGTPEEA
jgi:hypothetical protein